MSVQVTQKPAPIAFSRNPVVFQFETDGKLQTAGTKFRGRFYVYPAAPATYNFKINYGTIAMDMVATPNPDDSGYQVRSRWAGATDMQFAESLAADLQSNFYLDRDFLIQAEIDPLYGPGVKMTARKNGTEFNASTDQNGNINLQYIFGGNADVPNPNFKLYYELWVQGSTDSEARKCSDAYLEIDAEGLATIDVSGKLTDTLLANGFEHPDFSSAIAQINNRSICKYFLRFAEVYGNPQTIKRVFKTEQFYIMLGGISNEMLDTFHVPNSFIAGDRIRFLKQDLSERYILPEQAEFLSIVLFIERRVGVQLKFTVYYDDDSTATIYKHALGDVEQYTKLTFPVGFVQNSLNLINGKAVVKYSVVLVDAIDAEISETRTYWLDYEFRPYARQFIYLSSMGTYDTLVTYGRGSSQYELVQNMAEISTGKGFILAEGDQINYANSLNATESVTSGYREKSEIRLFKDLALSLDLLLYRKKRVYAVAFASKNIKEFKDADNLHAISFDFGYRYSEQMFTVDDQDDLDTPLFMPFSFAGAPEENPLPDNSLDYRYYLKAQTLSIAEIQALVAVVQGNITTYTTADAQRWIDVLVQISNKAEAVHIHDDLYIPRAEMQDLILILNEVIEEGAGLKAENVGSGLKLEETVLVVDFNAVPTKDEYNALRDALIPHPVYGAPSVALSANKVITGEIGQTITDVTLSQVFTQRDAGQAYGYQFRKDGEFLDVSTNVTLTLVLTGVAVNYQGAVYHYEGSTKNNVLGMPDPTGKILAGTALSNVLQAIGYNATWYGATNAAPSGSAGIRALQTYNASNQLVSGKQLTNAGNVFTHRTGIINTVHVIVVAPGKSLLSVIDLDSLNKDITDEYVYQGTISVNTAAGVPTAGYKLHVKTMGVAYTSSKRHQITLN